MPSAWREYNYIRWNSLKDRTEYHPLLSIDIGPSEQSIPVVALIDSGSEICTLNTEMAELLGVDLGACRIITAAGIGGGSKGYLADIQVHLPDFDFSFNTPTVFTDTASQFLLGQSDFFLHFNVLFERAKGVFKLSRVDLQ